MESGVKLLPLGGRSFLKVSFAGHFNNDQAHNVISTLKSHGIEQREKIAMIWDCTEMKGYDSDARETWQKFFDGIKAKIDVVHLVSDNIVYRAAARSFGIFWGVKVSAWSDYSQLEASFA